MTESPKKAIIDILFNTSLFRIVYIIDLFLGMFALLEGFSLVLRCIILSWGALILIKNFILNKKILDVKYYKILFLFLLSAFFTTVINFHDNLLANLLFIYHSAICFFVFYGMYVESDIAVIKKEMKFIMKLIIVLTTIANIIGFVILMFKVQISVGDYFLGIYLNRFLGIYYNPNLLALSCVLSIVFTHMILSKKILALEFKHKYALSFYIGSLIINFAALILSDSNASFLFLIIYVVVYIFYFLFSQNKKNSSKTIIKNTIILVCVCILLSVVGFTMRNNCQDEIATIINNMHQSEEPIHDNTSLSDNLSIGRSDYEISSGRIRLLKQAVVIFLNHPVMGIGRGNLVEYGSRELPYGLAFSDLHNGYATILVSYGLVGFIIFLIFTILVATYMCKNLFNSTDKNGRSPFSALFAIIVSYCIYSLFEKTILSEITFMVVIFWLILGYAMTYLKEFEKPPTCKK